MYSNSQTKQKLHFCNKKNWNQIENEKAVLHTPNNITIVTKQLALITVMFQ